MLSLLSGLSPRRGTSTSDAYWDEKATELAYLEALAASKVMPTALLDGATVHDRALATMGSVKFEELLNQCDVDSSYPGLLPRHIATAIAAGISGVLLAHHTNGKTKELEKLFVGWHEQFKSPDGCSPTDYRPGAGHRYIFGHDFNLWQKLPDDYTYNGVPVGGRTLYALILDQLKKEVSGAPFIGDHLKAILHLVTHYLSDLPTKDGLPLPFSSFFTEWVRDVTKSTGYSANNSLMDALGREFGTINCADVASYAIIKSLLMASSKVVFNGSSASGEEKDLHNSQMSVIAYGTALIIQMALLVCGDWGRTGKLNFLIAGPFLWNAGKATLIVHRQHVAVVTGYDQSLAVLNDRTLAFDDWVRTECK